MVFGRRMKVMKAEKKAINEEEKEVKKERGTGGKALKWRKGKRGEVKREREVTMSVEEGKGKKEVISEVRGKEEEM